MKHRLKVFIAGSKALATERSIVRNVLMQFQTRWNIMIEAKSFEDFSSSFTKDGRQSDYNAYITEQADLVIFVIASKVGNITMAEFLLGYSTFFKNGRPEIFVFVEQNKENIAEVEVLKQTMNNLNQYYVEYVSTDDLNKLLSEELSKYISEHRELLLSDDKPADDTPLETPRECARQAYLLGQDLFYYLYVSLILKDDKEIAEMIRLMRCHLDFWGIDYSDLPTNEYGFPSPNSIVHKLEMDESIDREYWNIILFVYNYLLLCMISVTGGLEEATKIHNTCRLLYSYTNLPQQLWDKLPSTIEEFDETRDRLMHFYCNSYIDNVTVCSHCKQRVVSWRLKCSYCGNAL